MTTCLPIPLISDFNEQDEALWVGALQKALDLPTNKQEGKATAYQVISHRLLTDKQKAQTTVAIVSNPALSDLASYPNLIWLQNLWAGVDKLLPLMSAREIQVARMCDPHLAISMSQSVLLWVLYLYRDMPVYHQQQTQRIWKQLPAVLPGDCTVGVLGLGNLGERSACRLRDNGFTVLGWSKSSRYIEGIDTYIGEQGLKQVLQASDILVVLLPLTDATKGLLNADKLAWLKESASILNFARGAILPEKDLLACLDTRTIKHAVLDVFEQEPLPAESRLWQHPNITVLPHISALTHFNTAATIVAQNIHKYFDFGHSPEFVELKKGY